MTAWIGLGLGGVSYSPRGPHGGAADNAFVGRPTWGPAGLLRDLELRLGVAATTLAPSARLPRWAARMRALAAEGVFCTESFLADEVGPAKAILAWRDDLLVAGWDGRPIPNGG